VNTNNLVAIIILNFNRQKDVLECLKSVSNLDYSPFETIVVDNGSKDSSVFEIKNLYPTVHIIESKINLGVAGGRNLGISYANEKLNYKYLLFLDDDIVIDKCALSEMVNSFNRNENIGIVTPKCYLTNFSGVIGYAGGMSVNRFTGKITDIGNGEKDEGQFDESKFISSCGGLCLISNELINKVGIFDDHFNPYGWEDVDLSLRSIQKGFKIFYNPKAIVYHKGGKKGRGKAIDEYEFSKSKNYFYLIKKHATAFQLVTIFAAFPFRILPIIFRELIDGDFKIISMQLKGILSLFKIR
jgi:GT2 family glycosyltransferase